VVRHQFALAQANLGIRLHNGLGIGAGNPIEAIGYGADLYAAKLGVDHLRAKYLRQWHGSQCDLP
jgi:hypothetical protein